MIIDDYFMVIDDYFMIINDYFIIIDDHYCDYYCEIIIYVNNYL